MDLASFLAHWGMILSLLTLPFRAVAVLALVVVLKLRRRQFDPDDRLLLRQWLLEGELMLARDAYEMQVELEQLKTSGRPLSPQPPARPGL